MNKAEFLCLHSVDVALGAKQSPFPGFSGDFVTLAQAGSLLLWWALNTFPVRHLESNKEPPRNNQPGSLCSL